MSSDLQSFFKGKLWKSRGKGGWYFITLPKKMSKSIRQVHGGSEEGWGRLKTLARIEHTSWKTAVWFDTKAEAYVLPVKAEIRKKLNMAKGESYEVHLEFEAENPRGSKARRIPR